MGQPHQRLADRAHPDLVLVHRGNLGLERGLLGGAALSEAATDTIEHAPQRIRRHMASVLAIFILGLLVLTAPVALIVGELRRRDW